MLFCVVKFILVNLEVVFCLENGCLIESANRSDGRPFDFFRRRKWRSIIEKKSKNLFQSCSNLTIVFLRNLLFLIVFLVIVTPKIMKNKGTERPSNCATKKVKTI